MAQGAAVDAQAEVAAALFAASATQAATEKAANAQITALRAQITAMAAKVRAGQAGRAELVAAEQGYVAKLADTDQAYGAAIAVFRGAVTDIAATPEGAAALARFNDGDEIGALAILDKLHAANEKGRQVQADIADAAEERRIAALALEARARGKLDTNAVIARYEAVTKLDPAVHDDWVQLDRLYLDAGRLADAQTAARTAVTTATADRDRAVSDPPIAGDISSDAGDLAGAEDAYKAAIGVILLRLANADPSNGQLEQDISMIFRKIRQVRVDRGDLVGARQVFEESLEIDRGLDTANPNTPDIQQSVAASLNDLGAAIAQAQGDLTGARTLLEEALAISRRLASAAPADVETQHDLATALKKSSRRRADGARRRGRGRPVRRGPRPSLASSPRTIPPTRPCGATLSST